MPESSSAASTLKPGQQIGGCRIIREIKRGGMGCVYLAEDARLGRRVAVKTILPFHDDDRGRKLFLKEAKTCAQVDHPNVIVIHQAGEERGIPFIVMPFVDGKNLSEFLKDQGEALPWQTVVRVIKLAVKGLAAVHVAGLVHRDIKPSNIMVSGGGRVFLMDFGLVRDTTDTSIIRSGAALGTPNFMSPEQARGEEADPRGDIFSIGSTLYHLLTNEVPFGRGRPELVIGRIGANQPIPTVRQVNPAVPRAVSDVVERAMAFDRKDRYQSAADLNRALRQLLSPQPEMFVPPSSLPEPEASQSASVLKPQLAPLDLVPLDLTETQVEPKPSYLGRIGLVVAAFTALVMLLLAAVSQPDPSPAPVAPPLAPEGMVAIRAGTVHLGATRARLDAFFRDIRATYGSEIPDISFSEMEYEERSVVLPAFYIDRYEVTVDQYLKFVRETGHEFPEAWNGEEPPTSSLDLPITGITLADAEAYAASIGKELPTVEQWVRAFRGDSQSLFPWGDEWDPGWANVGENDLHKILAPVLSTPRDVSEFGVYNLVGNALEMTRDRARVDGSARVIAKGAHGNSPGWFDGHAAHRYNLPIDSNFNEIGFRCVRSAPPDPPTP